MIGRTLGRYRILRKLGAGGMGVVYEAEDGTLGRTVALKFLSVELTRDEVARTRFLTEARAASRLDHPNICTVHEIGESEDGQTYIVMTHYDGESLDAVIRRGPLAVDKAIDIARQVASGLARAHRAGIVHRDIKPANLILTPDGVVKIIDFGLAKLMDTTTLTKPGALLGTIAYMSPEQIRGGEVDAQSDVWSLGVILYEMLAGRRPFDADYVQATMYSILNEEPAPLDRLRPDVDPRLQQLVHSLLSKKPADRITSEENLLERLEMFAVRNGAVASFTRPFLARMIHSPWVWILLLVVLAVSAAVVATNAYQQRQREAARAWVREVAVPKARAHLEAFDSVAAWRTLTEADSRSPGVPEVAPLLDEASTLVQIETDPPGATVEWHVFSSSPDSRETLGTTPASARLPFADLMLRITHPGYAPVEQWFNPLFHNLSVKLVPSNDRASGMAAIPGGFIEFNEASATLAPFFVDKYEVTNRDFFRFVREGGYEQTDLWPETFDGNGRTLTRDEAMQHFVDRAGRRGPSTWEGGSYLEGQDDEPVSGVSWYESRAYCRSIGKELPTIFHWHAAAEASIAIALGEPNFLSKGKWKVGDARSLGFFGTYDMAGNVREWCENPADSRSRYILGGSYVDPSYMFVTEFAREPLEREPDFGFRCMLCEEGESERTGGLTATPYRDYRLERPMDDASFEFVASLYRFEKTPLDARVDSVDESSSQWCVERVSFTSSYSDERIEAFVYIPRGLAPPWQAVVYFPGSNVFMSRYPFTAGNVDTLFFSFLVRSGRVVIVPKYRGSYERFIGHIGQPNVWPEVMRDAGRDIIRTVDYLEARDDIDAARIAFLGMSMGAALGPLMTAVEPRFEASVLIGGGLYFFRRPPQSEVINFLPRSRVPTLMLNGRYDFFFRLESSARPLFENLGTPAEHKKLVVFEQTGHIPNDFVTVTKESLDWLDKYLGPAERQRRSDSHEPAGAP